MTYLERKDTANVKIRVSLWKMCSYPGAV